MDFIDQLRVLATSRCRVFLLVFLFGLLSACDPSVDGRRGEGTQGLAKQDVAPVVDDEISIPAHLLSKAKVFMEEGNYAGAKVFLDEVTRRFPESAESKSAGPMLSKIAETEKIEAQEIKTEAQEIKKRFEKTTKTLKKERDEILNLTWISHKKAPILGKYASLYFGSINGVVDSYPLRLKFQYSADNWIFFDKLVVKIDDEVFEFKDVKVKRDNAAGTVFEWVDIPVSNGLMIEKWVSAKRVLIRFVGSVYYDDFIQPKKQKQQMSEVYSAWKELGGHF